MARRFRDGQVGSRPLRLLIVLAGCLVAPVLARHMTGRTAGVVGSEVTAPAPLVLPNMATVVVLRTT